MSPLIESDLDTTHVRHVTVTCDKCGVLFDGGGIPLFLVKRIVEGQEHLRIHQLTGHDPVVTITGSTLNAVK
jgi:hypothetical protein